MTVANPYANLSLKIPRNEWEGFRRFTTTFRPEDGSKPDIDRSPFDRYVDLWWGAFCVGVRKDRSTTPSEWHDFVTGVVLNQDPWRIRQIELVALAQTQDPAILEEPGKVISIVNEYAATGIPVVLDVMTGQTDPIWSITRSFRELAEVAQDSTPQV